MSFDPSAVTLTNTTDKDVNLVGNPLSVTVTTINDGLVEGDEKLTFDIINSAWEGANPDGDYGGEGNDYIHFTIADNDSYDVTNGTSVGSLDGNGVLDITSTGSIDFSNLDNVLTDKVESINLEGNNQGNKGQDISISLDQVLDMTDDTNRLVIEGDNKDNLNVDTTGWSKTGDTTDNEYTYTNDSGDSITLIVDEQIDTTGM